MANSSGKRKVHREFWLLIMFYISTWVVVKWVFALKLFVKLYTYFVHFSICINIPE